jgi:hypothetical protein
MRALVSARRELAIVECVDFGPNPHVPQYGLAGGN